MFALILCYFYYFFLTDTATTKIYTLSLHDALPICLRRIWANFATRAGERSCWTACWILSVIVRLGMPCTINFCDTAWRSEEHTSELQSHSDLVCRLLLEKKKKKNKKNI